MRAVLLSRCGVHLSADIAISASPPCFIGEVLFPSHSFCGADRWMYLIISRVLTSEFHISRFIVKFTMLVRFVSGDEESSLILDFYDHRKNNFEKHACFE